MYMYVQNTWEVAPDAVSNNRETPGLLHPENHSVKVQYKCTLECCMQWNEILALVISRVIK